ncbi:uncharacterized protein [Malus domestica]|uniref:uncharacterized protein isoform X1 n=1 Tax=Malus domestica TaxID=3750 RepID=UPI0039751961
MNCRLKAKSKAKSLVGSVSSNWKNSAQAAKLLGVDSNGFSVDMVAEFIAAELHSECLPFLNPSHEGMWCKISLYEAMNRRLTAKSKAKLRMGSGSWQVMNSAQEPKLLDKKKEKNVVQDSLTELNVQLEDTTSEKKTCEPEKCVNKVCRVCLKVSHWTCECSYLRRVLAGVSEVGKGYVIVCLRCPSVRNRCKHNISRAVYVYCYICKVWGQHITGECSKIPRRMKEDTKENALILYL